MFEFSNEVKSIFFAPLNSKCPDCLKNCKSKRGCLITQIQNEINKERTDNKIEYMAVHMKFPSRIPDEDVAWALSTAKDGKRRTGYPFGKAIFGMIKPKIK